VRITNPAMGELEIDPARVVDLPGGLVGFPELRRFAVVDLEEGNPFRWLQSMDQHDVGFIISEPTLFAGDYHLELRAESLARLGVESLEETVAFVLVSIGHALREVTANLRAPVIVSLRTQRGFQAALTDPRYSLRAPLPAAWVGVTAGEAPVPAGANAPEDGEPCLY
jgi:flagellar assembly factor FliW